MTCCVDLSRFRSRATWREVTDIGALDLEQELPFMKHMALLSTNDHSNCCTVEQQLLEPGCTDCWS